MKNGINSLKERYMNRIRAAYAALFIALASTQVSMAVDANTDIIDDFIQFATEWLAKIGGVVALVGGVMFALGWQREDAEGKTRGLQTMMAGFMVIAISGAYTMFFK